MKNELILAYGTLGEDFAADIIGSIIFTIAAPLLMTFYLMLGYAYLKKNKSASSLERITTNLLFPVFALLVFLYWNYENGVRENVTWTYFILGHFFLLLFLKYTSDTIADVVDLDRERREKENSNSSENGVTYIKPSPDGFDIFYGGMSIALIVITWFWIFT